MSRQDQIHDPVETAARAAKIKYLRDGSGLSFVAIGKRLGISSVSVRNIYKEHGGKTKHYRKR